MASIKSFCEWMRIACEDWSLGYDQSNRYDIRDGGESDCSSLVIWALNQAGFETGTAGYTGNLSSNLTARGWKRLTADIATCKPGDILLNDRDHVCVVISGSGWNAIVAQASGDEHGGIRGGQSGDQTGRETNTRMVYIYPNGWNCILRYVGEVSETIARLDVDGHIGLLTVAEWQAQCGTSTDSVVSGQYADCVKWFPRLESVTTEGGGSALMMVVQAIVGVPSPKGAISRGTICKLQGHLVLNGYDVGDDKAGCLDEGTAKAIQRSLNDGKWTQWAKSTTSKA